tara:strand:- start:2531 stop:2983 length:453 start_codon:yes stop_codon:yes gene_type:complete
MAGFLSKIFSSGVGDAVEKVGGVLDKFITTKEEKAEALNEINKVFLDAESKIQQEVSARWNADMASDSWLSKNIRPLVMIFLVVSTVLLIFVDAGIIKFVVKESWVDLLQLVLITVIGAYFGGRSVEKIKNTDVGSSDIFSSRKDKKNNK